MVSQISVYLQNTVGSLRALTKVLAEAKIDMLALSVADTADFGIIRLIVRSVDFYNTVDTLRSAGYVAKQTPVLCVAVPNKPAGLDGVLSILEGISASVDYMYSFNYSMGSNALMILRIRDEESAKLAEEKLLEAGITPVTQEQIDRL